MPIITTKELLEGGPLSRGTDAAELLVGTLAADNIDGQGGDDQIFGLAGHDKLLGGLGDDTIFGGAGDDTVEGGDGEDDLRGGSRDDRIVGNKGNDRMSGGSGNDLLVWNNGDGSDKMNGGSGYDRVQVNFDTDLVNDDLQNKDVAEFSVTDKGVQFARIEVNDQTERGLFQLDIRKTEDLETNFGGGDDTAVIVDLVLDEITLDLDGGDGIDTLDLSQAAGPVGKVDLGKGQLGDSAAVNFENVVGTAFDDRIRGDREDNVLSGGDGEDRLNGRGGDDRIVGNKGDDKMSGGAGNDLLVWNNGDGSDKMNGGSGYDRVQVNFDTDLVNDDLQNKDVAEFSVTDKGVQFARIEVNDQTERGLFQLDIRKTEDLETNFGGGDDTAVIVDLVLDEIRLDLDGGDGIDTLDLSQAAAGIEVDLSAGTMDGSTAVNFENVTGTAFDDTIRGDDGDNVIRSGSGNDIMSGGAGADTFVFDFGDEGVDVILDFEVGVDSIVFEGIGAELAPAAMVQSMEQVGDDIELSINGRSIMIEDANIADLGASDLLMA
ncbi:calcium-binding protein [Jannaschia aquimarina]|uniref:Cya_5 protein n=1 Tax=Jannaschia aquimarina TaxID=935700 RepID=A0A0D1EBE4_9RHOB|nr:calcium-binding protein [Jannaschia aquimarina]KIT15064.1 Bifunctional hemolysin/adenylate cyclase precursor [Jannaschia aquimarina]SNS63158.1 Hemolysin-type calcium-binding repeat-containing protein [Jannaschia aquimarina]